MTIGIPGWLQWVSYLVGEEWPEGDEDAMRRLASSWRSSATELENLVPELNRVKQEIRASFTGMSADAIDDTFKEWFEGDYAFDKMADAMNGLADLSDAHGMQVQYTKLIILSSLAIAAAEIAAALASAWVTFGASTGAIPAIEALTTTAVRQAMSQLLRQIVEKLGEAGARTAIKALVKEFRQVVGRQVAKRAAERAAAQAARSTARKIAVNAAKVAGNVAFETALGVGQDLAIQEYQKHNGWRKDINWGQVRDTAISSSVGALAGNATSFGAGKLIPSGSTRLSNIAHGATTGYLSGVTGNLAGTGALWAGNRDTQFTATSIFGGASSGAFSGGAHGAFGHTNAASTGDFGGAGTQHHPGIGDHGTSGDHGSHAGQNGGTTQSPTSAGNGSSSTTTDSSTHQSTHSSGDHAGSQQASTSAQHNNATAHNGSQAGDSGNTATQHGPAAGLHDTTAPNQTPSGDSSGTQQTAHNVADTTGAQHNSTYVDNSSTQNQAQQPAAQQQGASQPTPGAQPSGTTPSATPGTSTSGSSVAPPGSSTTHQTASSASTPSQTSAPSAQPAGAPAAHRAETAAATPSKASEITHQGQQATSGPESPTRPDGQTRSDPSGNQPVHRPRIGSTPSEANQPAQHQQHADKPEPFGPQDKRGHESSSGTEHIHRNIQELEHLRTQADDGATADQTKNAHDKSEAVRRKWDNLSSEERRAIIEHETRDGHRSKLGDLDGLRYHDRDAINRHNVVEDMVSRHPDDAQQIRDFAHAMDQHRADPDNHARPAHFDPTADKPSLRNRVAALFNDNAPYKNIDAAWRATYGAEFETNAQPRQLITYDPKEFGGDGRIAIAVGDLDKATVVSIHTPGITSTIRSIEGNVVNAENHHIRSSQQRPEQPNSVISWIGYDAPSGLGLARTPSDHLARIGGYRLAHDIAALSGAKGPNVRINMYGHSYGSTTTAFAGEHGRLSGYVDTVTLLGSPGAGPLHHARDFQIGPENVYVASNSHDLVTWLGATEPGGHNRFIGRLPTGLGLDPAMREFGATRIAAEYASPEHTSGLITAHVNYFSTDHPNVLGNHATLRLHPHAIPTESLANFVHISTGDTHRLTFDVPRDFASHDSAAYRHAAPPSGYPGPGQCAANAAHALGGTHVRLDMLRGAGPEGIPWHRFEAALGTRLHQGDLADILAATRRGEQVMVVLEYDRTGLAPGHPGAHAIVVKPNPADPDHPIVVDEQSGAPRPWPPRDLNRVSTMHTATFDLDGNPKNPMPQNERNASWNHRPGQDLQIGQPLEEPVIHQNESQHISDVHDLIPPQYDKKTVIWFEQNNPEHDTLEFTEQLKDQEADLNQYTADEWLAHGVHDRDANVTKNVMAEFKSTLASGYRQLYDLLEQTHPEYLGNVPKDEWVEMQMPRPRELAALHTPDLVVHGDDRIDTRDGIPDIGSSRINSSIGPQWVTRVDQIREIAEQMQREGRGGERLNLRLRLETIRMQEMSWGQTAVPAAHGYRTPIVDRDDDDE